MRVAAGRGRMRAMTRVLVFAVGLLFAGSSSTLAARPAASSVASRLPAGSHLLRRVVGLPSAGYAVGDSLYLVQTAPVGEHTGESYELSRVDAETGRMLAARRFAAQLDDLLAAGGSLWATTGTSEATLWQLDPRSLATRSRTAVPTSRAAQGLAGSLAAAGGSLWVGAGELDRVSLTSGRVERVVALPVAGPVQLASDSAGRILVASIGYEHLLRIARLNPRTGAVVAQRTLPRAASKPSLAGVVGGGLWLENAVGTNSVVSRLDIDGLKPSPTKPLAARATRATVRLL
ncbi:MAG: hypothetical protein JO199_04655, partial [Candidatus Eremiobacteraeota bacterium]|nr:hypothetical protein [Candidatus Eremiobacteraeota bacterium]